MQKLLQSIIIELVRRSRAQKLPVLHLHSSHKNNINNIPTYGGPSPDLDVALRATTPAWISID